jgi:hypothetical protein
MNPDMRSPIFLLAFGSSWFPYKDTDWHTDQVAIGSNGPIRPRSVSTVIAIFDFGGTGVTGNSLMCRLEQTSSPSLPERRVRSPSAPPDAILLARRHRLLELFPRGSNLHRVEFAAKIAEDSLYHNLIAIAGLATTGSTAPKSDRRFTPEGGHEIDIRLCRFCAPERTSAVKILP